MQDLILTYFQIENLITKKICLILTALFAFSSPAFAQRGAEAQVAINASVIQGLTVSSVSGPLNFGDAANTIVKGAVGANDTVITVSSDTRAVKFSVTADAGSNITVTYPATGTLNGSVSGTLTYTPTAQWTPTTSQSGGTPIASGVAFNLGGALYNSSTIYVWLGGKLGGATTAAPGTYSGTITVTVSY
ncbi:MAG: DUF4402 domain-containing protein [Candidatus Kryptoniota bacterium]